MRKRYLIDGLILLGLTICVLSNTSTYRWKRTQQIEAKEDYLEDRQFFKQSSFSGFVLSQRYFNEYDIILKIKLYQFEKLRSYGYNSKYDFTSIRDSIIELQIFEDMYNRIDVGDTIKKEKDSLSLIINETRFEYYERFKKPSLLIK